MKKNILFVSSLPDNHQVQVATSALNGALKYKYPGTCDLYHYMCPPDWNTQHILLDKHPVPIQLSPDTHYLINQVAEPDTHTSGLERVQQLSKAHPHLPVFNSPVPDAIYARHYYPQGAPTTTFASSDTMAVSYDPNNSTFPFFLGGESYAYAMAPSVDMNNQGHFVVSWTHVDVLGRNEINRL